VEPPTTPAVTVEPTTMSSTSEPAEAPATPTPPAEAPANPTPPAETPGTPGTPTTETTTPPAPAEPTPTQPVPSTAAPSSTAATPTPTEMPARPRVQAYLARTGRTQLTAAIRGADGQNVEVQRRAGTGWETVHTYPAVLITRLNDLIPGLTYRIVVPDSPSFEGGASIPVRL
jgi:hypothetical protein